MTNSLEPHARACRWHGELRRSGVRRAMSLGQVQKGFRASCCLASRLPSHLLEEEPEFSREAHAVLLSNANKVEEEAIELRLVDLHCRRHAQVLVGAHLGRQVKGEVRRDTGEKAGVEAASVPQTRSRTAPASRQDPSQPFMSMPKPLHVLPPRYPC
eukprot:362077-Chlamydomonas_euryale.AAC.1